MPSIEVRCETCAAISIKVTFQDGLSAVEIKTGECKHTRRKHTKKKGLKNKKPRKENRRPDDSLNGDEKRPLQELDTISVVNTSTEYVHGIQRREKQLARKGRPSAAPPNTTQYIMAQHLTERIHLPDGDQNPHTVEDHSCEDFEDACMRAHGGTEFLFERNIGS